MLKINKSNVDKLEYTKKGQIAYCDIDLPGFYVVVGMRTKTYFAQKDVRGKTLRHKIGRHGHFTPDESRYIAKDKLYLMSQGINPDKMEDQNQKEVITLQMVLHSYQQTRKNLSEATKRDYEYHLNKYVPDWLKKKMVDIDKDLIVARHSMIGKQNGHATANGVMRILRALFNYAHATYDVCEVNPVSYLSKIKGWFPDKRRRTYIKPHQLKAWWQAVKALDNDTQRDFLLLLLFTGLRRNEAASLRWENVDFKDRTISIQKTKNGDPLILPMTDFLYEMFEERRRRYGNHEFVFPSTGAHGFLAEPKKAIYKVVAESGIIFTCHDLRRTFITIAESLDLSYYSLKQLMNHRTGDVTSGYIIINAERLREPAQRIADFILETVK